MPDDTQHYVIVNFEVPADEFEAGLSKIGEYVDTFLSKQPGFVRSVLHRGRDNASIVHYAVWQSEADFQRAGVKAQSHPDLPLLRNWKPAGRGFSAWQTFLP